ncbi:TIR domain-containing protein [Butyrivibrio sp. INlla21]|uniref:TIR domain-containing protein n=1 Tax=Butyrivibrio sp. INlla21 TaxID=1520811 RepID=UPI0008F046AA|nr:TIR domain-containing protein [Butyrivibrio sp. INlla21]SFV03863.1 MTH538 TIR-like domain [Butyrivibrio sp. INlla21]
MASNVFISFRYKDGIQYKEELSKLFDRYEDTVDYSEDEDRSKMSEETIRKYLYNKLKRSSVTIILVTPLAVNHQMDWLGRYDDWMYDEIRYSLEERENNRTNGLVAVYTPEAKRMLFDSYGSGVVIQNVNNLFRRNMMNIKRENKKDYSSLFFDEDYDSYCSLVDYCSFTQNPGRYIDIALKKEI